MQAAQNGDIARDATVMQAPVDYLNSLECFGGALSGQLKLLNSSTPSVFRHRSGGTDDVLPFSICPLGNFSGYRRHSNASRIVRIGATDQALAKTFARLKPTLDAAAIHSDAAQRLTRFEDLDQMQRKVWGEDANVVQNVTRPPFAELARAWRSLKLLLDAAQNIADVEISVMDYSSEDLVETSRHLVRLTKHSSIKT